MKSIMVHTRTTNRVTPRDWSAVEWSDNSAPYLRQPCVGRQRVGAGGGEQPRRPQRRLPRVLPRHRLGARSISKEANFVKPFFHFISSRVETRRFQAMGQLDWIKLAQPHRRRGVAPARGAQVHARSGGAGGGGGGGQALQPLVGLHSLPGVTGLVTRDTLAVIN